MDTTSKPAEVPDRADRRPSDGTGLQLVPPAGWRPPPEAGRAILRLVLTAAERRAAA